MAVAVSFFSGGGCTVAEDEDFIKHRAQEIN
jgi:hypothetical protein